MSPAQEKAVKRHRAKMARQGIARVEISVPESDRNLVRELAQVLREDGGHAERLRNAIRNILEFHGPYSFIEFLQLMPEVDLDTERPKDPPRDIDL